MYSAIEKKKPSLIYVSDSSCYCLAPIVSHTQACTCAQPPQHLRMCLYIFYRSCILCLYVPGVLYLAQHKFLLLT